MMGMLLICHALLCRQRHVNIMFCFPISVSNATISRLQMPRDIILSLAKIMMQTTTTHYRSWAGSTVTWALGVKFLSLICLY